MFVRMAKTRKTFMLTIGQNGRDTDETLAHHPELSAAPGPRRGRAGPDSERDARTSRPIEKRRRQADLLERSACPLPETSLEAVGSAATAP